MRKIGTTAARRKVTDEGDGNALGTHSFHRATNETTVIALGLAERATLVRQTYTIAPVATNFIPQTDIDSVGAVSCGGAFWGLEYVG